GVPATPRSPGRAPRSAGRGGRRSGSAPVRGSRPPPPPPRVCSCRQARGRSGPRALRRRSSGASPGRASPGGPSPDGPRLTCRKCNTMFGRSNDQQTQEDAMPIVNVKVIEGVFDDDQKHAMVEKLTDAMVEIEGENMRGVTWVFIE